MKYYLLLLLTVISIHCNAQSLETNRNKIETAKKELESSISTFQRCLVNSDLDACVHTLVQSAKNEYEKYIIGTILYEIDKEQSFRMQKEAYTTNPNNIYFILEYALALHRKGDFAEAAKLYEQYRSAKPDDYRVHVWLSDCYINLESVDQSLSHWKKGNHANNHVGYDFAIQTVYGRADQLKLRNNYRKEIEKGNLQAFYPLISLDMTWELDWWNSNVQEIFLKEDLLLAKNKLDQNGVDYKTLQAYVTIKKLSKSSSESDKLQSLFTENKLIIGNYPLPANGKITSDLLRICFLKKILSERDFYEHRGNELLQLAEKTKDVDILNIYAYLQATVKGKVDPAIDRLGWTNYKDERFAISYFLGKADQNRFDDPELAQALRDFPNSSQLLWVKLNCAKIEKKPLQPLLTEVIKREFKTLASDQSRYSYALKSYFYYLENEK
ncbi:tetratricopeptide repeat protein [Flavobacterium sp. GCM10027622]|uniref:tetratricopeptide repeat protein n=1 Tax=unclassified Flavobacterium TaxID=196869 RepID=UPI003616CA31